MKAKIETESPLSIEEQIEVLELSKKELKEMVDNGICEGCCIAIVEALLDKGYSLYNHDVACGIRSLIPCFTRNNAMLSGIGIVRLDTAYCYWWNREVSKGGLTNRIAFLDWLIEQLKDAIVERDNGKQTTTE